MVEGEGDRLFNLPAYGVDMLIADAARYRRRIWQGHDEDWEQCEQGAFGLYGVLTDASVDERWYAANQVKEAFKIADKAEEWQGIDEIREQELYDEAKEKLVEARETVGLETDSVEYRIGWWKAYRHDDMDAHKQNLLQEQRVLLGDELAEKGTKILLRAADAHDKNAWERADEPLTDYYELRMS
jgi:hypothetical protein